MASLWTSETQSGRNNCGKDSCVLNLQYCCENVGLYNQYDDPHSSSPSITFIILHHCPSYNWPYHWSRSIRKAAADATETTDAAGRSCCTREKYCHHYILLLSLCRHVFDAFSCNIHHKERYLKFADILFENIDTAKKYRDNIDTFLRRYPSPSHCYGDHPSPHHLLLSPFPLSYRGGLFHPHMSVYTCHHLSKSVVWPLTLYCMWLITLLVTHLIFFYLRC